MLQTAIGEVKEKWDRNGRKGGWKNESQWGKNKEKFIEKGKPRERLTLYIHRKSYSYFTSLQNIKYE